MARSNYGSAVVRKDAGSSAVARSNHGSAAARTDGSSAAARTNHIWVKRTRRDIVQNSVTFFFNFGA